MTIPGNLHKYYGEMQKKKRKKEKKPTFLPSIALLIYLRPVFDFFTHTHTHNHTKQRRKTLYQKLKNNI